MSGRIRSHAAQSLLEYAVLVAAVTLGVLLTAHVVNKAFLGHAQDIEQKTIFF